MVLFGYRKISQSEPLSLAGHRNHGYRRPAWENSSIRFSGPRNGEFLAADEVRFTPMPAKQLADGAVPAESRRTGPDYFDGVSAGRVPTTGTGVAPLGLTTG